MILTFPSGIEFNSEGLASIPYELTHLQKITRGLITGSCAPPTFGKHRSDPIYRPGLFLQPREHCPHVLMCNLSANTEQYTALRTKELRGFISPDLGHSHWYVTLSTVQTKIADVLVTVHQDQCILSVLIAYPVTIQPFVLRRFTVKTSIQVLPILGNDNYVTDLEHLSMYGSLICLWLQRRSHLSLWYNPSTCRSK